MSIVAAFLVTNSLEKTYRSQARCYLPAQSDTLSLSDESGNLPTTPKLPTSNTETQTALLGVLKSAELRAIVASKITERNSEHLKKYVDFDMDTYNFIVISAYDTDPKIARKIAETYLSEFSNELDTNTKSRVSNNVETLVAAITRSEKNLNELESQKRSFLKENNSIDFGTEIGQYQARITRYQDALDGDKAALASIKEQREEVKRSYDLRPDFSQSGYTEVNNTRLDSLKSSLAAAQIELENLKIEFRNTNEITAQNNKIRILTEQIANEEAKIEGSRTFNADTLKINFETQLAGFDVTEADLETKVALHLSRLKDAEDRLRQLTDLKTQLDVIDAELRNTRDNLRQKRDRYAELELYMARTAPFLITAEVPIEATEAYFPIMWLNVLVAAMMGLAASIIFIIISAQIRTAREAAPW